MPLSVGSVFLPPFGVRTCALSVVCSGGRTTKPRKRRSASFGYRGTLKKWDATPTRTGRIQTCRDPTMESRLEAALPCHRVQLTFVSGSTPIVPREEPTMATYECASCGMSVNATCGACDAPLVDATLTRDDGSTVQVSKCPNDHGKIKSPMCCGADMSCAMS